MLRDQVVDDAAYVVVGMKAQNIPGFLEADLVIPHVWRCLMFSLIRVPSCSSISVLTWSAASPTV